MMTCPDCGQELVQVDNPLRQLLGELSMEPKASQFPTYHIIVDPDGGTVAVGVHLKVLGYEIVQVGSAKCHPNDMFNKEVGLALATARAFRRMANELEEMAGLAGATPHLEHVHHSRTVSPSTLKRMTIEDGGI